MSARPSLILRKGKESSLSRRHPWLFSGAVFRTEGNPAEGDLVDIRDANGQWLAVGHFQQQSIICKILSFDSPVISDDFFLQRLQQAFDYRQQLGLINNPLTNVFRLVHAEGDNLPGLIIDCYNNIIVLQAHSLGMYRQLPSLVPLLLKLLPATTHIFCKSATTLPGGSPDDDHLLFGSNLPELHQVLENGYPLLVNIADGQKTGFFVDQRESRGLLGRLAQDKKVLNCFGYTGGFSVAALAGGARAVETVDVSRRAIELCEKNIALQPHPERHTSRVADVLEYLDSNPSDFDIIVLDPPAFAKNHRSLQQGLKGYRSINQRALQKIPAGGFLFTYSCSQAVSFDDFQTMVFSAAALAHREVRVVQTLQQAPDHPVSIFHPEGRYLKGLLLYVL